MIRPFFAATGQFQLSKQQTLLSNMSMTNWPLNYVCVELALKQFVELTVIINPHLLSPTPISEFQSKICYPSLGSSHVDFSYAFPQNHWQHHYCQSLTTLYAARKSLTPWLHRCLGRKTGTQCFSQAQCTFKGMPRLCDCYLETTTLSLPFFHFQFKHRPSRQLCTGIINWLYISR